MLLSVSVPPASVGAPRRVLVTGAGTGIGRAVALRLASSGHDLLLLGRRAEALEETRESCLARGTHSALIAIADLSDESTVVAALDRAAREWGALDGLVNNAGQTRFEPLATMTVQAWREILDVNLTGAFLVLREALPLLCAGRTPAVVNVASTLATHGLPGAAAYCASKGGLLALTRAAAMELAPLGIRVNAVSPGPVATAMLDTERDDRSDTGERRARLAAMHPLGRIARPDDVAIAVCHLLAPDTSFVTGTDTVVDGGLTCGFRE